MAQDGCRAFFVAGTVFVEMKGVKISAVLMSVCVWETSIHLMNYNVGCQSKHVFRMAGSQLTSGQDSVLLGDNTGC